MNKFNRNQDNNSIVQNKVDEIILQWNNELSAEYGARKKIDYDIEENYLYDKDNMSLDEKKKDKE